MASVREALGRFNIVPSLDFENEALIDIPVMSQTDRMPEQPGIEINTSYNPFDKEDKMPDRQGSIDRFEKENVANWEKLYAALEKENENPEQFEKIRESQRKFFQIKNKYIVCPVKSGLMLIDQRRAHERVLYEGFIDCLSNSIAVSQVDMFPLIVEVNPSDIFIIKEIETELALLGFTIHHKGKNKITIKGKPAGSESLNPIEMLEIILEDYKTTQEAPTSGAKEKVASAMAAASSIPYGKVLNQNEMENLFDNLFACQSPNYSPKGKPVISILTLEDIDKRFKQ